MLISVAAVGQLSCEHHPVVLASWLVIISKPGSAGRLPAPVPVSSPPQQSWLEGPQSLPNAWMSIIVAGFLE